MKKKCLNLVETKKLQKLNIYYIVLHYKEFFFKHIPDVAYALKIYDVIV